MQTFYNFQTKKVIDPLKKINHFYISPYKPENFQMLHIADKIAQLKDYDIITSCDEKGHVVTVLPINLLIEGDCMVKWCDNDHFCINGKIYCKIVGDKRDTVRIDTVRF